MMKPTETKISNALLKENKVTDTTGKTDVKKENSQTKTQQKLKSFKIIVLGQSGVGKTCLSFRFCAGRFPTHSESTIGLDFREKIVEIDGERLKLQLWDTAGQERFRRSITHHYYRNVDAVVFVYDVNDVSSLECLDEWLEEMVENGVSDNVIRVLVGNKCDETMSGGQCVTTHAAQRWADDRDMPLFETSAKVN